MGEEESPLFPLPLCFPKKQYAYLHISKGFHFLTALVLYLMRGESSFLVGLSFPVFHFHTSGASVFREREPMSRYCQLCQRCGLSSALTNYPLWG